MYTPRRIIVCKECGREKPHEGKGMCRQCYNRCRTPQLIICGQCGEKKPLHAKGLCHKCYERIRYNNSEIAQIKHVEYYATNREQYRIYDATYYQMNRERIRTRKKVHNANQTTIQFLGKYIVVPTLPKQPVGYLYHHMWYNHADPGDGVTLLSVGSHTKGHNTLKELGIEIPHINTQIVRPWRKQL